MAVDQETCQTGSAVLLSGATGFLGMELLARYLERGETVYALVRAADQSEAQHRLSRIVASLLPPDRRAGQAVAVCADLERFALGLDSQRRNSLAERIDVVVHCAASV